MAGRQFGLDDDLFGGTAPSGNGPASGSGTDGFGTGRGPAGAGAGGREKFDLVLFIVSLILGVAGGAVALGVYHTLSENLAGPVVIMLTMACFTLIYGIVLAVVQQARGYADQFGKSIVMVLAAAAISLVLGLVFEFIYELGPKGTAMAPGSYILIIDDSGSMEKNDPDGRRYDAIDVILKDKPQEFPYAVFSFNSNLSLLREPQPKSAGLSLQRPVTGGKTYIRTSLDQVIDQINDGTLKGLKDPKVLLLTDGLASDVGIFRSISTPLKKYQKAGIAISTVGLGSSIDTDLMNRIAKDTGGVYINVQDVSKIDTAMKTAIESSSGRDLLSVRTNARPDILYCIERILFMAVLGILIGFVPLLAGLISETGLIITIPVKGIAAVLILELLMNSIGESTADRIYFVLIALVFTKIRLGVRGGGGPVQFPGGGSGGTANLNRNNPLDSFGSEHGKRSDSDAKGFF